RAMVVARVVARLDPGADALGDLLARRVEEERPDARRAAARLEAIGVRADDRDRRERARVERQGARVLEQCDRRLFDLSGRIGMALLVDLRVVVDVGRPVAGPEGAERPQDAP